MKIIYVKRAFTFSILFFLFTLLPFLTPYKKISTAAVKAAEITTGDDTSIKLNVKSKTLFKDSSYTLRVYNTKARQLVIFESSDPKTVSVGRRSGVITGCKVGTATITVTVKEGIKTVATLQCDVLVGLPAISVKFTKSDVLMTVNYRTTLKTILKPGDTVEEPVFTTSDSEIVTVSSSGKIFAKAPGKATITATIAASDADGNPISDSCTVTVVEEPITEKDLVAKE